MAMQPSTKVIGVPSHGSDLEHGLENADRGRPVVLGTALGVAGSVTCGVSMVLAGVGIGVSSSATGMAAMQPGASHGALSVLLRIGPWLLAFSAVLVTWAFARSRRRAFALPALLGGVVLYVGMYVQKNLAVMYGSMALGYLVWIGLFVWLHRLSRTKGTSRVEEASVGR